MLLSSSANAATLLKFDFENFGLGQRTGSASFADSVISANSYDASPDGKIENFGNPQFKLPLTRKAGLSTGFLPSLSFTNTEPILLEQIDFLHISNHNNNVTKPQYKVNLDLVSESDTTTLATFIATNSNGVFLSQSISGPGLLSPGNYSLRWAPQISSTGTDFIGLDNIILSGQIQTLDQQPVPGPLPLLGMGVAYRFSRTLRKRIGAVQGKQGAAV
ncbi:MAG: hypothetical protein RLZZ117_2466 [Cyanobacteriota bacterium]